MTIRFTCADEIRIYPAHLVMPTHPGWGAADGELTVAAVYRLLGSHPTEPLRLEYHFTTVVLCV